MRLLKSRWGRIGLATLLLCSLVWLGRERILFALGDILVFNQSPIHADAVVVLGGGANGARVLKGADLVQNGWAPVLVISGAGEQYGFHEADLATEFAVKHGFPREKTVVVSHSAISTVDEAIYDVQELRRLGVRRYIVVTSFSHTARARKVFVRAAPDLQLTTIGVDEPNWENGRWWTNREGRKIWFYAMSKSIADSFGI